MPSWASAYRDRRVLSETSAHVLYVGVHRRTRARRVVKVAREDVAPLRREVAALERLGGDGVVRLLEVHGAGAIALEHVKGPALSERIARRPLSARELERLARRLSSVVRRIGEAGFVHGDLKPENVLLPRGSVDEAVVIDFETATRVAEPLPERISPGWVAPERLTGQTIADPRVDLFSLGALLWAAFVGASPFEAETRDATLLRVLAHEPASPRGIHAALADDIVRMLSKDPATRTIERTRGPVESDVPIEPRGIDVELRRVEAAVARARGGEHVVLRGPGARGALDAVTRRCAEQGTLLAAASASREPYASLLPDVRRRLALEERAPFGAVLRAVVRRHGRGALASTHAALLAELIGSPLPPSARQRLDKDTLVRRRQEAVALVLSHAVPRGSVITVARGVDHESRKVTDGLVRTHDAVIVEEEGAFAPTSDARMEVDVPLPAGPLLHDELSTRAALWEMPFSREDLAATTGAAIEDVDAALRRWAVAGLVVSEPFGAAWRFADASVRDELRAKVDGAERIASSARLASWIASRHPRAYGIIARHFALANQPLRAAYYAWRAAARAQEGGDTQQATELLSLADTQLANVTGTVRALLAASLDVVRAQVHRWEGRHAEASLAARRALASLPAGSVAWCEAIGERATAAGKLGDPDEVLAVATALRAEPSRDAAIAWDRACSRTCVQLFVHGKKDEARALVALFKARTVDDRGRADQRRRGLSPGGLVYESLYEGRLDEHVRLLERSAKAFDEIGDERTSILYLSTVGFGYAQLGDYAHAQRVLEKTLARAEKSGAPTLATLVRHNLGEVLAHRPGKLARAIAVESEAILALRAQRDLRFLAASLAYRARMRVASLELDAAEADAREAVEHGGSVGSLVPLVFGTLALVLSIRDRGSDEARALADRARSALDGGTPVESGEALARVVFAKTRRDPEETRAIAKEAWDRLRARAATFTPVALRRSFLDNVPEHRELRALARSR